MNKLYCAKTLTLLSCLALPACATSNNKALDAKTEQENDVKSRKDLQAEANTLIENDPHLSFDQKNSS